MNREDDTVEAQKEGRGGKNAESWLIVKNH